MTMWKRLAARLRDDERGAIAVQFALLLIPIAVLTFGLIDLSRASVQKRQLQDALDAATLMAARSTATTNADLDAIGDAALATEMAGLGVPLTPANSTFALGDNNTVVGTIQNVTIKPIISNLWSSGDANVSASATVMRSVNKLEVALVLDNTGSMGSTLGSGTRKIDALIDASKSLVDVLAAAAARASETDAVKISVVPFSMTVNVGSTYQTQTSWLAGKMPSTGYGADVFATNQDRFTLLSNLGLTWAGCVESRPAPYDVTDDAPSPSVPASMFVPFFAPDEPDDNTVGVNQSSSTRYRDARTQSTYYPIMNNWLPDGVSPSGTSATAWSTRSTPIAKYAASNKGNVLSLAKTGTSYGPNAGCGLTSLMRLTNVRSTTQRDAVKTKLDQMIANGNTNVAMGLAWGWHTLSNNAPFADGVNPTTADGKKTTKVIVLLTDGDNTNDTYSNPNNSVYTGYGYIAQGRLKDASGASLTTSSTATNRRDAIDSREKLLCENAKAKGVQIYAIGVGVSSHSKTILQQCATKLDMYYDVTDAAELTSVFNTIAGSIQNLRITK
ncbi:TadE/TadG family type IV pilus assembly protein [Caulobacter sp. UNC279MFTsu5.1]|uniref:TadE/TadG family type IV pilus assembly protein n=1 Tax=Caulobacter sp. UNC279MFTsu5.1 TaxID=1502775 RepID=UPI0021015A10|nr:TadE/TadG family type IV pilus assembly protein [Caulobacter sp. UNC279MFTsu5.1]